MKNILLIFIIFISLKHIYLLKEQSDFYIRITNIISKDVSLGGFLFLDTDAVLIPSTSFNQENIFDLSIINDEDKSISSLLCFFYKFEKFYAGPAKIACFIDSLKIGKYHLYPLENTMSFLFFEIYICNILPFNLSESFNVVDKDEFYFYSLKPIKLFFYDSSDSITIKFNLFKSVSREIIIYLEDVPITCQTSGNKMICSITASELPQNNRYESLTVYIKDSEENKKINYFVYPVYVILNYIEKKTLKIKVSKLLTNCLTNYDNIIFDTLDDTLGNVIYSKEGFYLKIKNENIEDSDSKIKQLFCSFHKHPGENTKIFCERDGSLEDGIYTFEEYISEGPLDDEEDRISPNYKIVVPTFKSNGKCIYNSNYKNLENIYDLQLREKIELNFKNKEEILNITLNHEHYKGETKLFLGNSQIECYAINTDYINCEINGSNFDKSDIYYLEKMNFLEEKERLYIIAPFEVKVSWDN